MSHDGRSRDPSACYAPPIRFATALVFALAACSNVPAVVDAGIDAPTGTDAATESGGADSGLAFLAEYRRLACGNAAGCPVSTTGLNTTRADLAAHPEYCAATSGPTYDHFRAALVAGDVVFHAGNGAACLSALGVGNCADVTSPDGNVQPLDCLLALQPLLAEPGGSCRYRACPLGTACDHDMCDPRCSITTALPHDCGAGATCPWLGSVCVADTCVPITATQALVGEACSASGGATTYCVGPGTPACDATGHCVGSPPPLADGAACTIEPMVRCSATSACVAGSCTRVVLATSEGASCRPPAVVCDGSLGLLCDTSRGTCVAAHGDAIGAACDDERGFHCVAPLVCSGSTCAAPACSH